MYYIWHVVLWSLYRITWCEFWNCKILDRELWPNSAWSGFRMHTNNHWLIDNLVNKLMMMRVLIIRDAAGKHLTVRSWCVCFWAIWSCSQNIFPLPSWSDQKFPAFWNSSSSILTGMVYGVFLGIPMKPYPGLQRFLALRELGPKWRAAGGWGRGGAEVRNLWNPGWWNLHYFMPL